MDDKQIIPLLNKTIYKIKIPGNLPGKNDK